MSRIYHHFEKWECCKAGFYGTTPPNGMTSDEALKAYRVFLQDIPLFESALERVVTEWRCSCEQFLSNENINRIAWLGQASMCIHSGVPACFRGGFKLLTEQEQNRANLTAEKWLNIWKSRRSEDGFKLQATARIKRKRQDTRTVIGRVKHHIGSWTRKGYPNDIPDEVPALVASMLLAPSYKAIASALLRNDLQLLTLGYSAPKSSWYNAIKRVEIAAREKISDQLEFKFLQ